MNKTKKITLSDYIYNLEVKRNKNQLILTIFYHGLDVGNAIAIFKNNFWYLEEITVDPFFRNFKIGTKLIHNLLFLTNYNLKINTSCKEKKSNVFFKKIGFSLKKDKFILNLNKIETKQNIYSTIRKDNTLSKSKLLKSNFLVPILTENKYLSKKEL